ncbi:DUF3488 and transglutaminase-like domain-containing protein [Microbacterium natoriense]|uniref:transglutaminase family protein n=1 Tax=Microbacterium natoriense TaxID=284570 RepID=UPI0031DF9FE4
MSRAEPRAPRLSWHRDHELNESRIAQGALAAAAAFVAVWPYTSVIKPGAWSFAVVTVVLVIAAVGVAVRTLLLRRKRWIRETAAMIAQAVAALGVLTMLVAGDTAIFGVVPTSSTFTVFSSLAATAWEQVVFGTAPLDSTPGLRVIMGAGFAFVALLLDQLVAQRSAVLASVLVAVVGATPMIVTLGDANVVWFVMLGVMILLLFRQSAKRNPESPRRVSTGIAVGAGAAAVAAALVIAPIVPVSASLAGTGVGVSVDASLRLGNDLRQPDPVEVLTLATAEKTAPYLRLTTLSRFDGRVWHPDRGDTQSLSDGFGAAEWTEDVAAKDVTTSIRVLRMSSSWLPVPYPATSVQGLSGAWKLMPENRTIVSKTADAVGNDYTVASLRVNPSLEQIRAVSAAAAVVDPDDEPLELPDVIPNTAREVTADATSDYDRLIALQTWFRTEFSYSLETPVDEGFDGTGADAVAQFLDVRSGYCVHFAGAFALMAQSLGMDVRIVVGYLPGTRTDEKRGEETIYSVSSDQLHSWPEVLFPGIGWVPFEPTASLGVPTAFASATTTGSGPGGAATPAPTTAPTSEATSGPEIDRTDAGGNTGGAGALRQLDPMPVVLTAFGALLVLLLPALIRLGIGTARRRRARRGDAASAWAELRATLIDLRIALSDADSPRSRGAALVSEHGVDPEAMRVLTDAVERATYARSADPADLSPALGEVLAQLRRSVDRPSRLRALLLPRSLFAGRGSQAPLLV